MSPTNPFYESVKDLPNKEELITAYLKQKPTERWINSVPFEDILSEYELVKNKTSKLSAQQRRYVEKRALAGQ